MQTVIVSTMDMATEKATMRRKIWLNAWRVNSSCSVTQTTNSSRVCPGLIDDHVIRPRYPFAAILAVIKKPKAVMQLERPVKLHVSHAFRKS